ncbi:PAS domain S-box protein [Ectobacillus panaciterrae]|uniref:sensor histidine kinase n=1 Tax=Ectobacillus panaciterrae TaxID=363872 RepID=UPI0004073338|nr:PAS domain S-box protein [Ectobacillus panaciterrae]
MKNNQNLLSKEERYKIIAENTSDVIVLVDNDAIVRYVSPSFQSTSGYTIEEYEGMDAFDLIHPEDRDRVRLSHIQVVQTQTSVALEYRIIHAKGSTIYVETKVKPVFDDNGNVIYVVAVVRDITERKKTEQLLESILNSINAAVMSTNTDFHHYTFCSESIEQISGIPREEIMYNPIRIHDHIHPHDNERLMGEIKEKLDRGLPINEVVRFIHMENQTKWARMIIHPYKDKMGAIERLDGIILDITEKKQSELALEESEQRYKSLFENNLDGVFSIDLKGNFVNANQTFEKITGIQMDQLPDRCFIGLIYDEDHMPVYQILSEVMQLKEPRDVECRITRSGQGEKIVNITFVPIFLLGELNGVHGIVKDITKRKREELELIKSEERYKSLQQSINRFSNDLANVMKVTELEKRLIEEVKEILPIKSVSIEEIPRGQELTLQNKNEKWIKIADKEKQVFLKLAIEQTLVKMEEEWLDTAVHYVSILYDNLHFIEDLMKRLEDMVKNNETPKWMLRLLFRLSEKERASLSSDLHDSVLQDLIIWYRKLESLRSSTIFNKETKDELIQIEEGLLDAIHQIRITCNELRPPFLLKLGLVDSLKSLFSYARMFTNYEIEFSALELENPLNEDQILAMYRIVQELLNNATKHSKASKVKMVLSGNQEQIHYSYKDNGIGVDLSSFEGAFKHMGLAGITNRVLSLDGKIDITSAPNEGFQVDIYIPTTIQQKGDYYGNIIG